MGLIYTLLSMLMFNLNIGSEAIPYASIESAFASGDASKIVSYGKERMIVNVIDKEGVYSQSQASQVLKEFFGKKPASSFKFTFKGKETDDGCFAIGAYVSKSENYRVTIKWKKSGSEFKIESIAIEKT
jgi:adenylyl- and sulfurtransferase ThiI